MKYRYHKIDQSARKGFSLVELLVSLAIFGVISVMMSNIVISVAKFSLDNERRSDFLAQLDSSANIIKNDLRAAAEIGLCPGGTGVRRMTRDSEYFRLQRSDAGQLMWVRVNDAACNGGDPAASTTQRLTLPSTINVQDVKASVMYDTASADNAIVYIRISACDPGTPSRPIFDCTKNPYIYMFAIASRNITNAEQ